MFASIGVWRDDEIFFRSFICILSVCWLRVSGSDISTAQCPCSIIVKLERIRRHCAIVCISTHLCLYMANGRVWWSPTQKSPLFPHTAPFTQSMDGIRVFFTESACALPLQSPIAPNKACHNYSLCALCVCIFNSFFFLLATAAFFRFVSVPFIPIRRARPPNTQHEYYSDGFHDFVP